MGSTAKPLGIKESYRTILALEKCSCCNKQGKLMVNKGTHKKLLLNITKKVKDLHLRAKLTVYDSIK